MFGGAKHPGFSLPATRVSDLVGSANQPPVPVMVRVTNGTRFGVQSERGRYVNHDQPLLLRGGAWIFGWVGGVKRCRLTLSFLPLRLQSVVLCGRGQNMKGLQMNTTTSLVTFSPSTPMDSRMLVARSNPTTGRVVTAFASRHEMRRAFGLTNAEAKRRWREMATEFGQAANMLYTGLTSNGHRCLRVARSQSGSYTFTVRPLPSEAPVSEPRARRAGVAVAVEAERERIVLALVNGGMERENAVKLVAH